MKHNIADLFSLPGLHVHLINTTEKTVVLKAKSRRRTAECTKCGNRSFRIHQYHRRTVNHGYLHDKLVLVQLTVRRFKCKACHKPFTEQLEGITTKRISSHAAFRQLQDVAVASIKHTAEHHQRSWASVAGLLDDIRYEIPWESQGKRISIGIDEHALRKGRQMVTTVTNLTEQKKTVLTILPDDRKPTIVNFLKQIPAEARERITEVCIDMRGSFRAAIEEAWPNVNIVADPFHVVQLCSRAVEDVRRIVLSATGNRARVKRALLKPKEKLTDEEIQKLDTLWRDTTAFPSLNIAYLGKEKIRDLYRSRNRASAEKKLALILVYLEDVESRPLKVLRRTLVRWQDQILNHFDHSTSNGYTEGCHTKIKMLKRQSFGFRNRERYKIKMLLGFHSVSEITSSTVN